MSYKSTLQEHNILLQQAIEKANGLPESTGGAAENLDAEFATQEILLTEQDAKIAELAEILASKASGGTSVVETCTVTLTSEILGANDMMLYVGATVLEDGEVKPYSLYNEMYTAPLYSVTISNVVCGSEIILVSIGYHNNFPYAETDGYTVLVDSARIYGDGYDTRCLFKFKAPIEAGIHSTVNYAYEF